MQEPWEVCPSALPQSLGEDDGGSQRQQAAAWDVSLAGLGISPVGIDQKAGRNSQRTLLWEF